MIKVRFSDSEEMLDVNFKNVSEHVVELKGDASEDTSGFELFTKKGEHLGDYKDFTTIYRKTNNAVQFSNDGSTWVEPTKTIVVSAVFNDGEMVGKEHPNKVKVTLMKDGEVLIKNLQLVKENGYTREYKDVPLDVTYSISVADDVDGYEKQINGTTVYYNAPQLEPEKEYFSEEERLNDLELAICEIADALAEA